MCHYLCGTILLKNIQSLIQIVVYTNCSRYLLSSAIYKTNIITASLCYRIQSWLRQVCTNCFIDRSICLQWEIVRIPIYQALDAKSNPKRTLVIGEWFLWSWARSKSTDYAPNNYLGLVNSHTRGNGDKNVLISVMIVIYIS